MHPIFETRVLSAKFIEMVHENILRLQLFFVKQFIYYKNLLSKIYVSKFVSFL